MEILYQDAALAVCVKPAGICSQDAPSGGMPALLKAATGAREIFPVHRLDTAASGLMVYAKTPAAAAALSRAMTEGAFGKAYYAVVHGRPAADAGEYTDLLYRDAKKNKSYVVKKARRGVREAKLMYETLSHAEDTPCGPAALLRVRLFTGRTHQIRAQFASRGTPLLGDGRYGARDRCPALALFSCALSFPHPDDGRTMSFTLPPPDGEPWTFFKC